MLTRSSYDYAVIRVVPRVEREEFVNVGVILFCLAEDFLAARVHIDEGRILALSPDVDLGVIGRHLQAIPRICAGDPDAGPIARLSARERFHWLVAPRSTIIQISAVHSGMCDSPERSLEKLFNQLVAL
jgi:hypothetical protein